jgi:hypothetical protein
VGHQKEPKEASNYRFTAVRCSLMSHENGHTCFSSCKDRRPRHHQRSSDQVRHGLRLSIQGSLRHGASCPRYQLSRDRLANSTNGAANRSRAPVSTRKPCNLWRRDSPRASTAIGADRKHKRAVTTDHFSSCAPDPSRTSAASGGPFYCARGCFRDFVSGLRGVPPKRRCAASGTRDR